MQAQRVIRLINSEWRLHDRQIDDELDTRRIAQMKVCARRNLQLLPLIHQRKLRIDVLRRLSDPVSASPVAIPSVPMSTNSVMLTGPAIGMRYSALPTNFSVAAGERDGIGEDRNVEGSTASEIHCGPRLWLSVVADGLVELAGNVGDRRDRANVEPAQIVLSPPI